MKVESLKQKLKGTDSTIFVKATGRSTKPSWGNRIIKDFYDLDYDISNNLSKISEKFTINDPSKYIKANASIGKRSISPKNTL